MPNLYYFFVVLLVLIGIFANIDRLASTLIGVTALFYVLPAWGVHGVAWSQLFLTVELFYFAIYLCDSLTTARTTRTIEEPLARQ